MQTENRDKYPQGEMIEERCELYLQTVNGRLNEIERRMEMQCDEKKVVEIVRKTIGII